MTETPKAAAMKNNAEVLGTEGFASFFKVVTAICVGPKAEKRNRKVPRNSPVMAMKWLRIVLREPDSQFPREWILVGGSWSISSSENGGKESSEIERGVCF